MYIERNTFLDAKKIESDSIEKHSQTVKSPSEEFSEIGPYEYQELKNHWLKEIEESAPWYMKGCIRTGGWI